MNGLLNGLLNKVLHVTAQQIAAHNEMVCVYKNSEQYYKLFYYKTK